MVYTSRMLVLTRTHCKAKKAYSNLLKVARGNLIEKYFTEHEFIEKLKDYGFTIRGRSDGQGYMVFHHAGIHRGGMLFLRVIWW